MSHPISRILSLKVNIHLNPPLPAGLKQRTFGLGEQPPHARTDIPDKRVRPLALLPVGFT